MGFKGLLFSILIAFSVTGDKSFASGDPYPQLPHFGPNCWNFALMYKKAMPFYRAVNMHEFWHYMKSPYCRELGKNEKPAVGDIGSTISEEYGIIHSFALITPEMTLSKGSPYPDSQIEQQALSELTGDPNFPVIYHRCDFSKFKMPQDNLRQIEIRIDKYLTNQTPVDSEDLIKILDVLIKEKEALPKTANSFTVMKIESLLLQTFMLIPEADRKKVKDESFSKFMPTMDAIELQNQEIKNLIKERFK